MSSLNQAVALWVVSCCNCMLDASFLQRMLQTWEVNCAPLSEVITAGTTNLATQAAMSVSAQVGAAMCP